VRFDPLLLISPPAFFQTLPRGTYGGSGQTQLTPEDMP